MLHPALMSGARGTQVMLTEFEQFNREQQRRQEALRKQEERAAAMKKEREEKAVVEAAARAAAAAAEEAARQAAEAEQQRSRDAQKAAALAELSDVEEVRSHGVREERPAGATEEAGREGRGRAR
jgi:hypothetical protein